MAQLAAGDPDNSSVVSWSAQLQPMDVDSVVCRIDVGFEDDCGFTTMDNGLESTVWASSTWSSWSIL